MTNLLSELRMQCSPHEDGPIVPLSSPFKRPRQTFVTPFHQALLEIIHKTRHTDGNSGPILLHILIIFICMLPGTKQSRDLLVRWTDNHFFKQKMKMERERKARKWTARKWLKRKALLSQILALFSRFRSKNTISF